MLGANKATFTPVNLPQSEEQHALPMLGANKATWAPQVQNLLLGANPSTWTPTNLPMKVMLI